MKTGIYGGSFNPVHNGHIHLARSVMNELELDRIFFVPSRISPHRSSEEYVSGEDRLEMLRLACGEQNGFYVSDYELCRDRISYSVYTVEHFCRHFPQDEIFLLIGSDMLLSFDSWYRFEDILRSASLAAVSRRSGDHAELYAKAEELSAYGKVFVCSAPAVEISSTEIRKKIVKNENMSCYLPENVVQYIRSKGLYGSSCFDEVIK